MVAALAGIIIIVKAADVLTCYFNKKLCGGVYFEVALCFLYKAVSGQTTLQETLQACSQDQNKAKFKDEG